MLTMLGHYIKFKFYLYTHFFLLGSAYIKDSLGHRSLPAFVNTALLCSPPPRICQFPKILHYGDSPVFLSLCGFHFVLFTCPSTQCMTCFGCLPSFIHKMCLNRLSLSSLIISSGFCSAVFSPHFGLCLAERSPVSITNFWCALPAFPTVWQSPQLHAVEHCRHKQRFVQFRFESHANVFVFLYWFIYIM